MQKFYNENSCVKGFTKRSRFFVFLLSATLLSVTAVANIYNVTTTTDHAYTSINNTTGAITVGSGVGTVTLRSALQAADALGGTHTINVPAGTYTIVQGQIVFGNTNQNITITGADAATTIISMTTSLAATSKRDRIFFINPTGTVNSPIISISGLTFQNAYLRNDPFGGAAICAGGGSAEALTVTNCIFNNNIVPKDSLGGGAICMQVRGNLTVDNCTFTNNVSRDANGGAILFFIYNSVLGNGQGHLSVTNSTFNGNVVDRPAPSTSNGGAIAYGGPGGSVFFSATINKNLFTNNSADGYGGAISANNSPNLNVNQIHFNRFVGNTSLTADSTSALHFAESSGSVNAENNWWACNTNPRNTTSTAPCNQAGGDLAGGGSLDTDPWIQLKTTANPNPICNTAASNPTNTTLVTTSYLTSSNGSPIALSDLSLLIGLPVTWSTNPTFGSLSGQQNIIQANGTATATFTSNGTAGNATVNTQVDNISATDPTARATIEVRAASIAPTGATGQTTICYGTTTTLTVSGGLKGTLANAEWFTGSCGGTLVFTGDAFTTPALTSPTNTYYVRYSGYCNTTTCATVVVNVLPQLSYGSLNTPGVSHLVISQVYGGGGNTGAPYTNDFIEIFNPTASPVNVSGWSVQYAAATGTSWTVTNLSGTINPGKYYLIQEGSGGANGIALPTPDATGTIDMALGAGKVALVNSTVALSGACPTTGIIDFIGYGTTATCFEGVIGKAPAPSNTTSDLRQSNGCTDTDNNASDFATGAPNPRNSATAANLCSGTVVVCSGTIPAAISATGGSGGTGVFSYQWYKKAGVICPTGTDISGWTPLGAGDGTGFNTTTFTPTAPVTDDVTFALLVTQGPLVSPAVAPCGPPTWAAGCRVIVVNNVTGGTVGTNQTVCSGGDPAAFTQSVASTGDGTLTYQWQVSNTDCTTGFANIEGATNTTYDAPAGITSFTYYRRVTTSTLNGVVCTANSNCIIVIPNDVTGGTVGSDQIVCSGGDPAAFTVTIASTGSGNLTYQWQSTTEGCDGVFSNIGGATNSTYDPPSGLTQTTYYRRLTISTLNAVPCSTISNCVTVLINNVTGGTVGSDQTICQGGDPALFTESVASTGTGALTYQWQSSTTGCGGTFSNIVGATSATYDAPAGVNVTTNYRRVTKSTFNGVECTANSNCITVTARITTGGTVAASQTICSGGDPAAFTESVASTGDGVLSYQWQSSTTDCSTGFTNIEGATLTTYDPPAGLTVTTYYHRVTTATFNGLGCTAISNCITVTIASAPSITCPSNTTTPACQTQTAVNNAFTVWLATASGSGGVGGVVTNNNTGAPSACGGSTTVTFTYTNTCSPLTTTCQATFTVTAPDAIVLTCPTNTSTPGNQTQADVNAAFAAWLATASGTGGCNGVLTNNNSGAPAAGGGSTTVTFTYTSSCAPLTTTCQATFTVLPPGPLACPVNTTTSACQTQATINSQFAAWLATASGTGGCDAVLTNNNTGAPSACGGSTTVTFTYTSTCEPFTTTCQATFTVPAPPVVSLTCPVNTNTAACQTQAAVNSAFSAWLATASGTGGCNGILTNNNTGAPSACGGSTTVTFTYTSTCTPLTTTCEATFTVLAPSLVTLTCPVNTNTAASQTQAAVNSAFSAWLATASGTGGCNGVLTNNNTGAPPATGGSTTVTFTYTNSCAPLTTTCQATFTVLSPAPSLTCPVNTSTAACLTQAQVNSAFSAWLATASASGGCNGVLTNNNTGAPSACGGATTVTFTYTSTCAPLTTTCQATFTVPSPPIVSITCPVNTSTAACLTQAQVNSAFSAWLATASGTGGCNGVLTNNNSGAPSACGGATTVTFTYTSTCAPLTTTCQATFTVPAPPTIVLTCPVNTSTAACLTQAQVNTAFSAWLATASASGGCNGVLTNNNTGAPAACGGSKTVTFTYTSTCAPLTTTCQATFTVPAPPTIVLTCPVNTNTAACLTQAQVNTAFSAWLATASASGGCNGVLTNNNTGAPAACGGSKTVTFTYTSTCAPLTTTCQATFTVPDPPTIVLTCPVNTTTASCLSQAQVNTAFSAWLATASGVGGCNGVLTNNNTGAPDACAGGSKTVTFTYTSTCAPLTTTCQATFTVPVPSAVVLTCPVNTTTASCQTQAQINTAFAAWLATASASGCATLTNDNTGAPSACGGSTTVTFTATSSCAGSTTCSATFTVPADNTPPSITNEAATPASLWPPNHQMKDVTIGYTATDCHGATTSLSVTSNEPINGTGDGDTSPDWEIIDNHHVKLRAERSANGDGRIYTITITATDACGNTSSKNVTVVVAHNITDPHSGKSFKVGSTVTFSGTFWDKPGNKHTGKWLIDGTSVNATITEPVGMQNGKSTGSYKFNTPGVYKLQMNITDQNGVTSYANTQGDLEAIVVIYDPNGGYTYGGGYYDSQAGALTSDPSATGKASYGFSMNYFKNSTNPKGETQFDFKVGDFEYNALNFDYLVINNFMSQFKGTGKIIGSQSGINFIMTVIDGDLDGTGVDKVRMKIFNKNNGRIYYDNMPGASDAALPVQAVGTNSNVIITGTYNPPPLTKESEVIPETKPNTGLELAAYPNPTSSSYTIQVNAGNTKEKILLQVFDVSGRIIETRNNVTPGSTFTLGDKYRPSSYFIRVMQGKEHKEIKLVKLSD